MGNHLFSATDLMSLLLSLCLALLFHSLLSPPPASLYFCALSCPNSPQSLCKPQISHCPLFAGFLRLSTLDSFFLSFFFFFLFSLSHPSTMSSSSWQLLALRLFHIPWAVSTSCSQLAIWACNVSPCALTLSLSA